MAWAGDEIVVTIGGVQQACAVVAIERGPVARIVLADGRTIALGVLSRAERPKRKPRGRGVIAPPAR
jgi:hypothetical protein